MTHVSRVYLHIGVDDCAYFMMYGLRSGYELELGLHASRFGPEVVCTVEKPIEYTLTEIALYWEALRSRKEEFCSI